MRADATAPSTGWRSSRLAGHLEAWRRPALLTAVACLALMFGALVYLTDRDASRAWLIPNLGAMAGSNVFGALGQWLPSFVHPLSFSLLTAAALPPCAAARYGACAAWGAVNVAFELGQHPAVSVRLADWLQAGLADMPMARPLARYFTHGTFDPGDIAAALLGALAAAAVLRFMHRQLEKTHA